MAGKSLKRDRIPKGIFEPVRVVQILLGLDGLVWVGLGAASLLNQAEQTPDERALYSLIALMMFGNAAAMLLSAWLIGKQKKVFYLFTLALLLVNILLTFTDQFGGLDLATLILDVIICVLLIVRREAFLSER